MALSGVQISEEEGKKPSEIRWELIIALYYSEWSDKDNLSMFLLLQRDFFDRELLLLIWPSYSCFTVVALFQNFCNLSCMCVQCAPLWQ